MVLLPAMAVVAAVAAGRARLAIPLLLVPPALVALKRRDAVTLLTVYVVLLVGIPSRLVVPQLGSTGTPANMVGLVALFWWASTRLAPGLGSARGLQPLRIALTLFVSSATVSYALAYLKIFDAVQITAANRAAAVLAAVSGITLLAADGINSKARLDVLLRRLVAAAAAMATLGIVQFFTGLDIASYFQIPGLSPNYEFGAVAQRSIFNRVYATAIHPIEFGVVLSLALPLAIHYATSAPKGRRRWPVLCAVLIAFALPTSVSRSAVLALMAGVVMLFVGWTWKQRRQGLVVAFVFIAMVRATVPGLIGTMISLFTNISGDPSTTGRTDDYAYVGEYIKRAPAFGRGMFTFLPDQFTTLDNQLLLTTVEMGFVGLFALLLLYMVGICCARGARRRSADATTRQLGQALAGSILGAMLTAATFDELSFPMVTGLLFLLLGCAGALWRLTREANQRAGDSSFAERGSQQ